MKKSAKYYWQPDWMMSIVFWSATISCLFLGIVTLLEYTELNIYSILFFMVFLILIFVSFQRFLIIKEDGKIYIHSLFQKNRLVLEAKQIVFVRIDGKSIQLVYEFNQKEQSIFLLMRSKKREHFLSQIKNLES